MDCSGYRRLLSREIDGEADPAEREALERHLADCARCRRAREEMLELSALHRGIGEREPSPMLTDAIMAGLDRYGRRDRIGGFARIVVPIAAVLVIVLGIYAGSFIIETVHTSVAVDQYSILELDYLDGYPPGSVGALLFPQAEGGNGDEW